jgi:glycosyltransferase involved in cell wall biosynthesis
MISVVVNSLNEGKKLAKCIDSVRGFATEVVVVDMESEDDTAEISKEKGAKLISHQRVDYIEPIRQFEVDQTKGDWVMVMDPDETLPTELKLRLTEIAEDGKVDAVNISRLNFIFGKKMKHTNFWPDAHIRFFKRDKVTFSKMIHSYPKIDGQVLNLEQREELAIHHYPYDTVGEYWQRMKRYSRVEAKNLYEKGERFSPIKLIYMPTYDFIRRYVRHLGFLDGWRGLLLSLFQFYYYLMVQFRLLLHKF